MSSDRTCYNCHHWQPQRIIDDNGTAREKIYSCDLGEARPWFACARWHRIRTEHEKKEARIMEESMKQNDGLFKRLAKL